VARQATSVLTVATRPEPVIVATPIEPPAPPEPSETELFMRQMAALTMALASRPEPAAPTVTIAAGAIQVNNAPPEITVHPADTHVTFERGAIEVAPQITHADAINMATDGITATIAEGLEAMRDEMRDLSERETVREVERDKDGRPLRVVERKLKVVS